MKLKESKIPVKELKKEISKLSQQELIKLVTECYKVSDEVKNYLSVQFGGQAVINEIYEIAKKKITDEFYPEKGHGKLRLSEAKKAISDFKKYCDDEERLLSLMIYYVEQCVEFTLDFGDIDEPFYRSLVKMYDSVVTILNGKDTAELTLLFSERLESILDDCSNIGWGVGFAIEEIFNELHWIDEVED